MIFSAGLRIGEALSLQWSDLRPEEGLLYVCGGKGRKDRRVPLSPKMFKPLMRYKVAYATQAYIFEGQDGGKYSTRTAQQVLKSSAARASITLHITCIR